MKKLNLLRIIIMIVLTSLLYYMFLPALNLTCIDIYIFAFIIGIFYYISGLINIYNEPNLKFKIKKYIYGLGVLAGTVVIIIITNIIMSPVFNAKKYAVRISITKSEDFATEVEQVDFKTIPLLDKDSSRKLGDRVMGQMPELVSQFYVSDLYTQINYNNDIVRVTPLEYADPIKYFTNRKDGVKGYITVNSTTGESNLIKLDKGMKYMPSAMFNENLYRKLRFTYPTAIFGNENFEVDDEGNPYWIIPILKYKGVGLRKEVSGAVILDPITGESKKYKLEDIPTWVDHIYSASLVLEQVNDWGKYQDGFINSLFGQKGVVMVTEGYNYIAMKDDIYLYTGITSVSTDESNLGFILTNLRTKETKFYTVPGAEEYSAMASAEGQVQQMNYQATFPLLINLNNKPTYLISLKDNAGLVKMYAFVDVENYQKVVVTDVSLGIEQAMLNYLNGELLYNKEDLTTKTITVSQISMVLIDGNSYYYIKDTEGKKYTASIKQNSNLPFIVKGDKLNISYLQEKDVIEIKEFN